MHNIKYEITNMEANQDKEDADKDNDLPQYLPRDLFFNLTDKDLLKEEDYTMKWKNKNVHVQTKWNLLYTAGYTVETILQQTYLIWCMLLYYIFTQIKDLTNAYLP
jgi:hypothetical protein